MRPKEILVDGGEEEEKREDKEEHRLWNEKEEGGERER